MSARMLLRHCDRPLSANCITAAACPSCPSVTISQYLHQDTAYNSILVWKDDKDPLGVRIPGT